MINKQNGDNAEEDKARSSIDFGNALFSFLSHFTPSPIETRQRELNTQLNTMGLTFCGTLKYNKHGPSS